MNVNKISAEQFEQAKKSGVTSSFEELDVNKDGVIDINDSISASSNTVRNQINVLIGADEEAAVEGGEEAQAVDIEKLKAEAKARIENLQGVAGVGDASSLAEVNSAIQILTDYIAKLDGEIAQLDGEIASLEATYTEISLKKEQYEKEYGMYETRMADETANLNVAIKFATGQAEQKAYLQNEQVMEAVARANKKFNAQEGENGQPLKTFIEAELSGLPGMGSINMSHIDRITDSILRIAADINAVATNIELCISQMTSIKGQIDTKKTLRDVKVFEKECAQAKLDELNTIKTRKEAEEAARNSGGGDGGGGGGGGGDPIGFYGKNGERFDFVVDRNQDGKFNGANEFLGYENYWNEMVELDKDGDGVVQGKELEGVKVLKTDKNGQQSFVDASSMGIKVDLNSYQKAEQGATLGKGQELLGSYSVTANGQNLTGYNTFDSNEYLNKEYGGAFGLGFGSMTSSKINGKSGDLQFKRMDTETIVANSRLTAEMTKKYVKDTEEAEKAHRQSQLNTDKAYEAPKATDKNEDKQENNPFKKELIKK